MARQGTEEAGRATKRHRANVEEAPDVDAPLPSTPDPSLPGPPAASDAATSARADPEPGPSRPTRTPAIDRDRIARRRLRCRGGLYVEDYPDPLAGAPISPDHAIAPNLDAYMQSCGRMADPEDFEAAELLMTSGMTDAAKDRHFLVLRQDAVGRLRRNARGRRQT